MAAEYAHLIGGLSGGFASTVVCHPLDLLKIRYSVDDASKLRPKYHSYWHAARCIVKAEGIRGLYQGLSPNLIASPLSWGLYFQFYHKMHPHFSFLSNIPGAQNLTVGCVAGATVMAITNPLWVAKTRLCLQYESEKKQYKNLFHCLSKILKDEGIRGWYKGFVPALFGTFNGAIQFAIYNSLKSWRCKLRKIPEDSKLSTADYLAFSSLSKALATASTYPYQVVRARLQDHHTNYQSSREVIVKTVKTEGIYGLYKGMLMATIKQLPTGVVTYVVYEHSRHFIQELGNTVLINCFAGFCHKECRGLDFSLFADRPWPSTAQACPKKSGKTNFAFFLFPVQ
uniref:Mitochondrial carrier protein n=1 Tax=Panagrolaimus sp. JU765 TaxID=591449 RepID=A0AC34QNR2_9BILA